MTDNPHNPGDPFSGSFEPDDDKESDDEDLVEAIFMGGPTGGTKGVAREPFDLGWLFLCWAWEAGYRDWNEALRVIARVLRGLERIGLIERRTIRRTDSLTHHGFVLTDEGREAVRALTGDWIEDVDR